MIGYVLVAAGFGFFLGMIVSCMFSANEISEMQDEIHLLRRKRDESGICDTCFPFGNNTDVCADCTHREG